jgi:5-methylcytosine-specific restriction endonuclease McrA
LLEATRPCRECGDEIVGRGRGAIRCIDCARRIAPWDLDRGPRQRTYPSVCEWCSSPFTATCRARFCSAFCSGKASHPKPIERKCVACDSVFVGRADTCSKSCYRWKRAHPGVGVPSACGFCAARLPAGATRRTRYCSRSCAMSVMSQRRRAAMQGKPVHRVVPIDVFERDRWTCHLCAEPVDRSQRGKHPAAPALDHIIPVAHPDYPGHIAANLACAHWSCNVAKRDRVTEDDFALFARLLSDLPPGEPVKRRRDMGSGPNTHCIYGHEYTPENTYLRPDGKSRQCRTCIKRRSRAAMAKESPARRQARLEALRASRPNGWKGQRLEVLATAD